MATLQPTSTPTTNDEPKIYISKATLQLKHNFDDFKFSTQVYTPPNSPLEKEPTVLPKHVQTTTTAAAAKKPAPPPPVPTSKPPNKDRFTPAHTHGESDSISSAVSNFMAAERYDSQTNWRMNHSLVHHAGGDMNTSEV